MSATDATTDFTDLSQRQRSIKLQSYLHEDRREGVGSVDVIGVYSWGLQGGCAVALRAAFVLDLIQNSYGCAVLGVRPVASDLLITNR